MKKLTIKWYHPPLTCIKLAERRTGDIVSHYGRNIRSMSIETLAASCYLQGVEDCFAFVEKRQQIVVELPLDWQI